MLERFLQRLEAHEIGVTIPLHAVGNFDYGKHITNSLFSYICLPYSLNSFAEFFISDREKYFKHNSASLKKFFTGLLYYIGRAAEINDRHFYSYLLFNDIEKKILKEFYSVNLHLTKRDDLKVEMREFYQSDQLALAIRQVMKLDDAEFALMHETIKRSEIKKQYVHQSIARLIILEVLLLRGKVLKKTGIGLQRAEITQAKTSVHFPNFSEDYRFEKTLGTDIFAQKERRPKPVKRFTCFRFDFSDVKVKCPQPDLKRKQSISRKKSIRNGVSPALTDPLMNQTPRFPFPFEQIPQRKGLQKETSASQQKSRNQSPIRSVNKDTVKSFNKTGNLSPGPQNFSPLIIRDHMRILKNLTTDKF